jgi:hypothetical protein
MKPESKRTSVSSIIESNQDIADGEFSSVDHRKASSKVQVMPKLPAHLMRQSSEEKISVLPQQEEIFAVASSSGQQEVQDRLDDLMNRAREKVGEISRIIDKVPSSDRSKKNPAVRTELKQLIGEIIKDDQMNKEGLATEVKRLFGADHSSRIQQDKVGKKSGIFGSDKNIYTKAMEYLSPELYKLDNKAPSASAANSSGSQVAPATLVKVK